MLVLAQPGAEPFLSATSNFICLVILNFILISSTSPIKPDMQEQGEASTSSVLTRGLSLHLSEWTQHVGLHSMAPITGVKKQPFLWSPGFCHPQSSKEQRRMVSPSSFCLFSAPHFFAFSTEQSHTSSWSSFENDKYQLFGGCLCLPPN